MKSLKNHLNVSQMTRNDVSISRTRTVTSTVTSIFLQPIGNKFRTSGTPGECVPYSFNSQMLSLTDLSKFIPHEAVSSDPTEVKVVPCDDAKAAIFFDGKSAYFVPFGFPAGAKESIRAALRKLRLTISKDDDAYLVKTEVEAKVRAVLKAAIPSLKLTAVSALKLGDVYAAVKSLKQTTTYENDVYDAVNAYKKNSKKRNHLINVLSRFRGDRNKPEFSGGIKDWKAIVQEAKQVKPVLPKGLHSYLAAALKFYEKEIFLVDQKTRISNAVASLFSNVNPKHLQDAVADGYTLNLIGKQLSGESISKKTNELVHAAHALALQTGFAITNGIDKTLHEYISTTRKVKEESSENPKRGQIVARVSKETKNAVRDLTSDYKAMTKHEVETQLKSRSDIRGSGVRQVSSRRFRCGKSIRTIQ